MDEHLAPLQTTGSMPPPAGIRPLGLAALFSGAALLATILFDVSLRIGLLATGTILVLVLAAVTLWISRSRRGWILRTMGGGAVVGIAATVTYDAVKLVLATLDPSPYNPFEAVRHFGVLLVGADAGSVAIQAAGWAFHLTNGIAFSASYMLLLGDRRTLHGALASGILWGIGLETFQLTLFPGWLSIGFLAEFQRISFLSHLVYGAILGLGGREYYRRAGRWT